MKGAFEIKNELSDTLEVWVEPWCHPYYVSRGSCLKLIYDTTGEHPLHTKLTAERLVVWPDSKWAPTAELDGERVEPDFDEHPGR